MTFTRKQVLMALAFGILAVLAAASLSAGEAGKAPANPPAGAKNEQAKPTTPPADSKGDAAKPAEEGGAEPGEEEVDEDGKAKTQIEDEAPEELDRPTIEEYMNKNQSAFVHCYEKELKTKHDLAGRVLVNFVIEKDGRVSSAKVVPAKTTLKDEGVQACVVGVVRTIVFPARRRGEPMEINYPIVFQKKKESDEPVKL